VGSIFSKSTKCDQLWLMGDKFEILFDHFDQM
jgi:hypothetical protein